MKLKFKRKKHGVPSGIHTVVDDRVGQYSLEGGYVILKQWVDGEDIIKVKEEDKKDVT